MAPDYPSLFDRKEIGKIGNGNVACQINESSQSSRGIVIPAVREKKEKDNLLGQLFFFYKKKGDKEI